MRKNSFTWRSDARDFHCPEEGAPKPIQDLSVACLVTLMWPMEKERYLLLRDTWGKECDGLFFFVASDETNLPADVINLAAFYPAIIRDGDADTVGEKGRRLGSGANQKDLLLFHWAAEHLNDFDWFCRIETDSYFSTAHFKRMAPPDPNKLAYFLGATMYWHTHYEPRVVIQEPPQCLSAAALIRVHNVVSRAEWVETPSYLRCELAPGHRGDLMLSLCAHEAFVQPQMTADERGREYFVAYPFEYERFYRPEEHAVIPDPRVYETDGQQHWKGKAPYYLPCWGKNKRWISPYAVSFHGYKNASMLRRFHDTFKEEFGRIEE